MCWPVAPMRASPCSTAATAKPLNQMPPEAGSYVVEIDFLGDRQHTATFYFDDAGERPPHALLWDIATVKSAALKFDAPLSCGTVVDGKLWVCSADGKTLTCRNTNRP